MIIQIKNQSLYNVLLKEMLVADNNLNTGKSYEAIKILIPDMQSNKTLDCKQEILNEMLNIAKKSVMSRNISAR